MTKELWKEIASGPTKTPKKKLRFIKLNARKQSSLDELALMIEKEYDLVVGEFEVKPKGHNLMVLLREKK